MRKILFTIMLFITATELSAQIVQLTACQQRDLEKKAIEKVETFQKNCQIVADTHRTYSEKTCKDGIIDVALEDFMEDARIEITNFDGSVQKPKAIRRYLLNLALLSRNRYREISITWVNCAMSTNFVPDPNRKEWYVGEVKIIQRFSAITKEFRKVEDSVERITKVYAKRHEILANNKWVTYWDVMLGDIAAKTIE